MGRVGDLALSIDSITRRVNFDAGGPPGDRSTGRARTARTRTERAREARTRIDRS